MLRPWRVLTVFGVCLAIVLATMAWVSVAALRLERADRQTRQKAALEENARLALWRMDSSLAVLIAEENGRPYGAYEPFYRPANGPGVPLSSLVSDGSVVPSPMLTGATPNVLLHFQTDAEGVLTSPQAPRGDDRLRALEGYATEERLAQAQARLTELAETLDADALARMVRQRAALSRPDESVVSRAAEQMPEQLAQKQSPAQHEQQLRGRFSRQIAGKTNVLNSFSPPAVEVRGSIMTPFWIDGQLILARQVVFGGGDVIQGAWLDWPAIRASLLQDVKDLLPQAQLDPLVASDADPRDEARLLAALPIRLIAGEIAPAGVSAVSPMRATLAVAWIAVVLAVIAVAVLMIGILALSERRGAFVSAVTHELRTPLTTFRLYTDMLDDGTVADEQKRRRYVRTLRGEADRLAHLVENVLSFARLERGRGIADLETISAGQLLTRVEDRLADRARQAGMELEVGTDPAAAARQVRGDAAAIERILFNLVENACRYASSADRKTIEMTVAGDSRAVRILVRDHGSGVARDESRLLFRPFQRSRKSAAKAVGGVGLGLALSRRLARRMGGELELGDCPGSGACFVLSLATA